MKQNSKLITKNKKAYFDYEIIDSWEAGIMLKGYETKSIRAGHVNLKGSYISEVNGELYVKQMHITPWKALQNRDSIEHSAPRKIFLHKKTVLFLSSKIKEKGLSVIPLEIYFKGALIKFKIALAKGRKQHQKKQVLKERVLQKEADRSMKQYY